MGTVYDIFQYLRGYQHVGDFQKFCGVESVEVETLISNKEQNGTNKDQTENSVHKRTNGIHKNGENGVKNGNHVHERQDSRLAYKINNKLIYCLMEFGANLGSELFYISFFPFLLWNVDARLCRQLLIIWYPLMYFGQLLKDMIRWPRPGSPAVRLEGNRFELEYGMPSTHTIVGTCVPISVLILTSKQYEVYFYVCE